MINKVKNLINDLIKENILTEPVIPINLMAICNYHNISINDYQYSDGTIGQITFQHSENDHDVHINLDIRQNRYEPRKRFTIAHELGHFFLHKEKGDSFIDNQATMSRNKSYWNPIESEANSFAAELLMPIDYLLDFLEEKLSESLDSIDKESLVDSVAKKFNVSKPAATYRLTRLGVL